MLSEFQKALQFTLKWEGGWSNDPHDPGGATMRGVTQRVYDGYRQRNGLKTQSVYHITQAELEQIYFGGYWRGAGCDALPWPYSLAVFDLAVNCGAGRARSFVALTPKGTALQMALRITAQRESFYHSIARVNPALKKFLVGWARRTNALKAFMRASTVLPAPTVPKQKRVVLNGDDFTGQAGALIVTSEMVGGRFIVNDSQPGSTWIRFAEKGEANA